MNSSKMRRVCLLFYFVHILTLTVGCQPQTDSSPFVLERKIDFPGIAEGPYSDHLALDLARHRIFATPQASKAVVVADLDSGKMLHLITGLKNPHAIFYRSDLNRIYVTDSELGAVNIYDGDDYSLVKSISLKRGAVDHLLYVACRNTPVRGAIVALDTRTGAEVANLSAAGWIDNIEYDVKRQRIYASSGLGKVQTYQKLQNGKYEQLSDVDTEIMAKTSLYSPELDRMLVSVPRLGFSFDRAKILVLKPTN